ARAPGIPRKREVLLKEECELPARHRLVHVAERRPGLILAVSHLGVGRRREHQDRAHPEGAPSLRASQEEQGEPREVTDACVGRAVLIVELGDGPLLIDELFGMGSSTSSVEKRLRSALPGDETVLPTSGNPASSTSRLTPRDGGAARSASAGVVPWAATPAVRT